MKRKLAFLLLSFAFMGFVLQSCGPRHPKCPGVYSKAEPVQKVKHV